MNFQTITFAAVFFAFATVGLLIGWLIGASNSPVVAGALPLIFGLIGGFSFRYLENQAKENSYVQKLKNLDADEKTKKIVANVFELNKRPSWLPAFWAIAVIIFCAASYQGIRSGIDYRLGSTRTLSEVLVITNIDKSNIESRDWIILQNTLFRLRSLNASDQEIEDIFIHGISPLLSRDKNEINFFPLKFAVDEIFGGLEAKEGIDRGPASEGGPIKID